jgi:ribonuclease HI
MFQIYSDGGSRGNPGSSAYAFIILQENGELLKTGHGFLGIRTNNQAEYEALAAALKSAIQLRLKNVECFLDSELVVKQLSGRYRVKDLKLKDLWCKVERLRKSFGTISFVYVPRTNKYIQEVDELVNETLDKPISTRKDQETKREC